MLISCTAEKSYDFVPLVGCWQAAKTAGKAVRAFKPTFDELTSVSRDLRSTLDQELGINDIRNEFRVGDEEHLVQVAADGPALSQLQCCMHVTVHACEPKPAIACCPREFGIARQGSNYTAPSRGTQQPSWDELGTQAKSSQPAASSTSSSQDIGQAETEDIAAMRARSADMAWGNGTDGATAERAGSGGGGRADDSMANVSLDELQAELARRRAAKKES